MKVRLLEIENFRGAQSGTVKFQGNTLLVGSNNAGKSTVCEALDLVLGPERLNRRPPVDEHDFYEGRYVDEKGAPVCIVIHVVLTDLTDEARRRFSNHLRRWHDETAKFIDDEPAAVDRADGDGVSWALPLTFRARYDREEDDFEAETFFAHPIRPFDELDEDEAASLGPGLSVFTRKHKRLCGFVFLRTLRTGSRALGLQRGSLLDTILRLGGEGVAEMWHETLDNIKKLEPAVGEVENLKDIRAKIRERMGKFVSLTEGDDSTAFFASDLTRQHLREIVRLFIATQPSDHAVPFSRQGTGSINLLVFALLTIIADIKETKSVIFAMEEPEIALPPHTQRRVTRHVLGEMGQSIVTSHSPYVIEQFGPNNVVMLTHGDKGKLAGQTIDADGIKPKAYRNERRQFAEAILARAVLVVEGSTETALFPAASSALERFREGYTHFDLAGVTVFTASGDGDVPRHGTIFNALGKQSFGVIDQQATDLTAEAKTQLARFDATWESPERGIEALLVKQTPVDVLRSFLADATDRPDYPTRAPYDPDGNDETTRQTALAVLKARKGEGYGYAAALMEHCKSETDIPEFIRTVLTEIDAAVTVDQPATNTTGDGVETLMTMFDATPVDE